MWMGAEAVSEAEVSQPDVEPDTSAETAECGADLAGIMQIAEQLYADGSDPLRLHWVHNNLINQLYRRRDRNPSALDQCLMYCRRDIALFPHVIELWRSCIAKYDPGKPFDIPRTPSFERLAIMLEKQGRWQEAVEICDLAIRYGIPGDPDGGYQKRKERLERRIAGGPARAARTASAKGSHQVAVAEQANPGIAACVDVETTGLDPAQHEIIELSLVLFAFDRKTGKITTIFDEYSGLRDPGRPIPREATRVHGLTRRDVAGKRLDEERVNCLLGQAEFLVAHNAKFDYGFLVRLFPKCAEKPWLCSMSGIGWKRAGFASKALQNLLRDHGIEVDQSHRAASDAKAVIRLLSCSDKRGRPYFHRLVKNGPLDPQKLADIAARQQAKREEFASLGQGCGLVFMLLGVLMLIILPGVGKMVALGGILWIVWLMIQGQMGGKVS